MYRGTRHNLAHANNGRKSVHQAGGREGGGTAWGQGREETRAGCDKAEGVGVEN